MAHILRNMLSVAVERERVKELNGNAFKRRLNTSVEDDAVFRSAGSRVQAREAAKNNDEMRSEIKLIIKAKLSV